MALRVLLADDHQVVRQGLKALLERDRLEVVGEGSDGWQAIELTKSKRPDVVVLDLSMPRLNGLDAAREILRLSPSPGVILLTMHGEEHLVVAALRAGIRGYVTKTQAAESLSQAIMEVARGGVYLTPGIAGVVVGAYLNGSRPERDPLAPRERQVLQLVAEGKTTKEIATLLTLTVKSAESYRSRVMEKLDIHDTAGLVRYAIRHGLIEA